MRSFAQLLLALIFVALAPPSAAVALTVTSAADAGPGSLRQALADATDGTTIDFALATPVTITLTSELVVDQDVTISGPGTNALTIDGDAGARVFHVSPSAVVTITDLTVANGKTIDGGGGIFNESGTLTLRRIVVRQCVAGYGAGLANDASAGPASMTVVDSSIRDNHTTSASGGGLYNDGTTNTATMSIERSTVSGNTATNVSAGGGILNSGFDGGQGTLIVHGSTFSGNTATTYGGGIASTADANGHATARISNSTFANNIGDTGNAIFVTIYAGGGTSDLEIGNTILSGSGADGTITAGVGTIQSAGFNLASDAAEGDATTGPGGLLDAPTDRRNTNPLLGVLQANGGPTFTHALLAGSPAIDQGRRDTIATLIDGVDQRSNIRPADDPSIVNAVGGDGSDIGAFEAQPPGDLAVTALKAPKSVTLTAKKPTVAKTLKATIQNRSALPAAIPDLATLAALIAIQGTALGPNCAAPTATLVPGKPKLPATIKPKGKLTATFSAAFACAGDPLKTTKKTPGHDDFRWVATVDRTALGTSDDHPDDDVCPRPTLPNGLDPRPNPAKPIKDKGCGGKLSDKTLGADVVTDVVVK